MADTATPTSLSQREYAFCETLADIAYLAGARRYHSGDSRKDVETFIAWAREFEEANRAAEWGNAGFDYLDDIEAFTNRKLHEAGA